MYEFNTILPEDKIKQTKTYQKALALKNFGMEFLETKTALIKSGFKKIDHLENGQLNQITKYVYFGIDDDKTFNQAIGFRKNHAEMCYLPISWNKLKMSSKRKLENTYRNYLKCEKLKSKNPTVKAKWKILEECLLNSELSFTDIPEEIRGAIPKEA